MRQLVPALPKNTFRARHERASRKGASLWRRMPLLEMQRRSCMQAPWYIVKRGHWCKHCLATAMGRSIESMQEFAASKGGKCLFPEYLGSRGTLSWMCDNGHLFRGRPDRVCSGYWCAICLRETKTKTERNDESGSPRKSAR
jgi:hypothetical protein